MDHFKYEVTIVVPVYNSQDFIRECIESIIQQKMDISQIEVLLIDDGSTDNSGKICQEFAKKYANISYIYKENSGVSDTRNTGIKRAQGKYIMLLDSDDYLDKHTVSHLIHFFDKHYDEVDLVTYPIYWDREGKISLHARYSPKNYDKGTGVYDLDQYAHINQSTVNIIFKNEFENNLLYDTSMKLSEDQNYNTSLLVKKNKIGYVKNAKYFYRRHGLSVSQTRNNPYYCFEDIMSYNEGLLERFCINGKVSKYVQTLVVNTLNWRVKQDELLPYYLENEEFQAAKERIKHILQKIDDDVIVNHSNCDGFVKLYFLKWKGAEVETQMTSKGFKIMLPSQDIISEGSSVNCYIYRTRMIQGNIEIFASFSSHILEIFPIQDYIVEGIKKDGKPFRETHPLKLSKVPFRNTKMSTAHSYVFTYRFDPNQIKRFTFKVNVNGTEFPFHPQYIKFCGFIRRYMRDSVPLGHYRLSYRRYTKKDFRISKQHLLTEIFHEIKSIPFYSIKHIPGILYYRYLARSKRKVWLYSDSAGVVDNAYYQFIHDLKKNDGIERYYVVDGDDSYLKDKLTPEQKKHIIKHRSKKHKELFLQSSKLFVSFSSFSIYSPFKNLSWYMDLLHFEFVYLQHGILHASLQRMYAKEFTQIDKFVISSDFEKQNLIENYDYSEDDFIVSGMPRMSIHQEEVQAKNKILLAPSWRQYLIGLLVNNRRALKTEEFLASDFFKEMNDFLHSSQLQEVLEKNSLELDFKLHPIFKEYRRHFKVEDVPHVDINFDKTILGEYKMFITDFSSYQFDFVKLNRPIIYFLPDKKEFKAGLHSYRDLDLKYENAFGKLCLNSQDLLTEMKNIIDRQFAVEEPYKSRMETFFTVDQDPCEKIYQEVISK